MWLINTKTLALEFFGNPPVGSYAILSHTWESDEEVTFQDFNNNNRTARNKRGFAKIHRTCQLARERDLPYAWVDTCCIDKSSSAELSEAINSMFRWYKDSVICFTLLSDLRPRSDNGDGPAQPDNEFKTGFRECRWVKRGWTLQELIAPRHVEFYDMSWSMRASKASHTRFLSEVTRISVPVLEDSSNLSRVLIAKRMSWASRRETTRVEDMAYCLLGLFDINLPMIYGEGEKAFMRLQEEIAKQSCDLSLLAWRAQPQGRGGKPQTYRGIFANSPAEFADCFDMRPGTKGLPIERDFLVTNKGLRIETTLVNVLEEPHCLVFNLGVREGSDWTHDNTDGWVGVYVTKTAGNYYVRARPHELYTATTGRLRCNKGLLYMRKTLSADESSILSYQYHNAIRLRSITSGKDVIRYSFDNVQPEDLWDTKMVLFLDPGSGLNTLTVLKFPGSISQKIREFRVVIACSTMGTPLCAIWSEQDTSVWNDILRYMQRMREISDYTTFDYLRDRFGKHMVENTSSICRFRDPDSNKEAVVEVKLTSDKLQGMDCFSIDVILHRGIKEEMVPRLYKWSEKAHKSHDLPK